MTTKDPTPKRFDVLMERAIEWLDQVEQPTHWTCKEALAEAHAIILELTDLPPMMEAWGETE